MSTPDVYTRAGLAPVDIRCLHQMSTPERDEPGAIQGLYLNMSCFDPIVTLVLTVRYLGSSVGLMDSPGQWSKFGSRVPLPSHTWCVARTRTHANPMASTNKEQHSAR